MLPDDVVNITEAIYGWNKEKINFDYETNTCKKGTFCGNYIQVDDVCSKFCTVTHILY
jgi:hypothetical protein